MIGRKLNFYALVQLTSFAIIGFAVDAQASDADWRLFGATKSPDERVTCFFDTKTIKSNADGNLKVWTKCLSDKAMDLDKMTVEHREEMITEAAKRLVNREVPPYTKTHKVDKDLLLDIGTFEAVANSGYVDAKTKSLWEINCEGRMSRFLTFSIFKDGRYQSSDKPDEWTDVPPDSTGSSLIGLVCPSK